jgi:hypothetical protein
MSKYHTAFYADFRSGGKFQKQCTEKRIIKKQIPQKSPEKWFLGLAFFGCTFSAIFLQI